MHGMRLKFAAIALLAGLACRGSTEPKRLRLAPIAGIEMPTTVSVTDTLTIEFQYGLGCDALDHLDVSQSSTEITFAVWASNENFPCFQRFFYQTGQHVQLVLPPRADPFTVRFRQEEKDSVVVVHTTGIMTGPAR